MPQQSTNPKNAPAQPTGAAGYLQIADTGTLWTAPSGAVIRVRDLTIMDRATVNALPQDLQEIINTVIEQSESLRGQADDEATTDTLLDLMGGDDRNIRTALDRFDAIGQQFVIMGWIEPQVVPTADDVTDPATQIPIARVLPSDRQAFMTRTFGSDAVEATQLATFPDKPAKRRGA